MKFFNISSKGGLVVSLCSLLLTFPSVAGAVSVDLISVSGVWQNSVGGTSVTGVGTSSIRWGNPATANGKSGFDFVGVAPLPQTISDATNPFALGTFTHINFPIYGGGPSTLNLAVTVTFANIVPAVINSTFNFSFLETPNYGNPCAAGGIQPCPDRVSFLNNGITSSSVNIGGSLYSLQILGFERSGGLVNEFITLENQTNSATLQANFIPTPPTFVPTPEPDTILLFGTGLAALWAWQMRTVQK